MGAEPFLNILTIYTKIVIWIKIANLKKSYKAIEKNKSYLKYNLTLKSHSRIYF